MHICTVEKHPVSRRLCFLCRLSHLAGCKHAPGGGHCHCRYLHVVGPQKLLVVRVQHIAYSNHAAHGLEVYVPFRRVRLEGLPVVTSVTYDMFKLKHVLRCADTLKASSRVLGRRTKLIFHASTRHRIILSRSLKRAAGAERGNEYC